MLLYSVWNSEVGVGPVAAVSRTLATPPCLSSLGAANSGALVENRGNYNLHWYEFTGMVFSKSCRKTLLDSVRDVIKVNSILTVSIRIGLSYQNSGEFSRISKRKKYSFNLYKNFQWHICFDMFNIPAPHVYLQTLATSIPWCPLQLKRREK